jgi:hypothetical protein
MSGGETTLNDIDPPDILSWITAALELQSSTSMYSTG